MPFNRLGGYDPDEPDDLARAKAVDLITLPAQVEGKNCGNCRFLSQLFSAPVRGMCIHPEVDQYVTDKNECRRWDAPGIRRPWLKIQE